MPDAQKELKDKTGKTVAKVVQTATERMVEIPERFSVRLSEGRVSIKVLMSSYLTPSKFSSENKINLCYDPYEN